MQTRFDADQLADPGIAAAAGAIRKCVHCGFCTATCPTYVLLGDELDSPRGRIYLIKDMLERGTQPSAQVIKHLDRCLSCLSCETHCPSGVSYRRVIDEGRAYVERRHRRPLFDRALRTLLAQVLPFPHRLRLALALAAIGRPFESLLERAPPALRPLAALLRLERVARPRASALVAPSGIAESQRPVAQGGSGRRRIGVAAGCVGSVLAPEIEAATIRLLERAGWSVVRGVAGMCCGALSHHLGREAEARQLARAQIEAWMREIEREGAAPLEGIVVTTSGCGPVMRDYAHLLAEDARYAGPAARVASLARDLSEVLVEGGLPPRTPLPRPVVVGYHPACSLQHGSGVTREPVTLLIEAGFSVRTPAEAHLCCGSAGVYNILQPALGRALGERKAAALTALQPEVIATGNIGCMTQLRSLTRVPVVHLAELLDWATGGARPAAIAAETPPHPQGGEH